MINLTIPGLYMLAALLFGRATRAGSAAWLTAIAASAALLGTLLHARDLYIETIRADGALALTLANTASLVALVVAIFGILYASYRNLRSLGVLMLVLAAAGSLVTIVDATRSVATVNAGWQLSAHILLSIVAYSLLTVAALLALLTAEQDRRLRRHRPLGLVGRLPPVETMESTLFSTLFAGFSLLSLAVFSGLIFVNDILSQHLAHKAALSLLAWIIFGGVLLGRWRLGWRGRGVVIGTLAGFALLALSYFGSRFVLEVLLGRQWG